MTAPWTDQNVGTSGLQCRHPAKFCQVVFIIADQTELRAPAAAALCRLILILSWQENQAGLHQIEADESRAFVCRRFGIGEVTNYPVWSTKQVGG